uniref:Uncharacterized protein n=1 Tax=Plectus sambesii TaxID=2011161 RepID=A0A914WE51_9BILA
MLASDGGSVDRVMEVQKALIELLHLSLTFFRRFSPNLAQASNDEAFDPESYEPLLELEYNTSGSSESARMLSFGSLLRCVHLCISALRKLDTHSRASTASPSAQRSLSFPVIADRTVMAMILEASIELVLAQTVHRLRHPRVAQADKDVLRREVATELGELMSRCQRYAGGSPSAQRRGSSTRMSPAASTAFDAQFIKFAQQFVQDLAHVS